MSNELSTKVPDNNYSEAPDRILLRHILEAVPSIVDNFFKTLDVKKTASTPSGNILASNPANWISLQIKFNSPVVSGIMEIVVDKKFGVQTWPIDDQFERIGNEKVGMLTDWIGEIGNRILGQILAVLDKFSVNATMGTPIVVKLPQFGAPCPLDETRLQIPFMTEYGCVHVFLQMKFSNAIQTLVKKPDSGIVAGDIIEW